MSATYKEDFLQYGSVTENDCTVCLICEKQFTVYEAKQIIKTSMEITTIKERSFHDLYHSKFTNGRHSIENRSVQNCIQDC